MQVISNASLSRSRHNMHGEGHEEGGYGASGSFSGSSQGSGYESGSYGASGGSFAASGGGINQISPQRLNLKLRASMCYQKLLVNEFF